MASSQQAKPPVTTPTPTSSPATMPATSAVPVAKPAPTPTPVSAPPPVVAAPPQSIPTVPVPVQPTPSAPTPVQATLLAPINGQSSTVSPAPQPTAQVKPIATSPPPTPAARPAGPALSTSVPSSPTLAPVNLPSRDDRTIDSKHRHDVEDFVRERASRDTTVDQKVEAAVTHETIKPSLAEVEQTAVVSDVMQEDYHTTVQNITDTRVLPEERTYNVKNVVERTFDHGDGKPIDLGPQFSDERIVNETRHEHSVLPTVVGEHRHFHLHERIQPIIHREIQQPSVVYTTTPIHDVVYEPVRYHATTSLPSISLAQYQRQGGALGGQQPLQGEKRKGSPQDFGAPVDQIIHDW